MKKYNHIKKILILIRGMELKADSIAFDAAFHYKLLTELGFDVECYCQEFNSSIHPELTIKSINTLDWNQLEEEHVLLIYHWCDGWSEIETKLATVSSPLIIRWHNNTPPWFFGRYSPIATQNTTRGYLSLFDFIKQRECFIWANSFFSREQLIRLGINKQIVNVVYPCSRYIEEDFFLQKTLQPLKKQEPLHILFVSRISAHKGHRHIIEIGNSLQNTINYPVKITFPGRTAPDMLIYLRELKALAEKYKLEVNFLSEISQDNLSQCYKEAHVFICCSEHEGFGLPVIEAMRFNLPVCAYAITALTEIIEGHPLAMNNLDYEKIAHTILEATQSQRELTKILKWQNNFIIPRYSKAKIMDQIQSALIETTKTSIYQAKRVNNTPTDFPQNWVTWHDLMSFSNQLQYPIGIKKSAQLLAIALMRKTYHFLKWIPGLKGLKLILKRN